MFEIFVDDYKAPYNAIPIGHQGENEARCLIWNLAPYIQEFGDDGVCQVKVTQPETKYVYFATNVAKVGNLAIWTVTNVDTAKHGTGMCELYYNAPDGTTLAKSDVYKTWIFPTQGDAGDAPSPYDDIIERVGDLAAEAEASSNSAAGYAEAAAQSATEAGAAAQSAVEESVAELQAELDQAISGATVDSEVINARVTSDGTTYSTLKQRLDAENADLKRSVSQNAIPIVNTASGAIASFSDGADDAPVKDLVVNIESFQRGTGDPSPDNVRPISGWTGVKIARTGKNLFDESRLLDLGFMSSGDGYVYGPARRLGHTNFLAKDYGFVGKPTHGRIAFSCKVRRVGSRFRIRFYYTDGTYGDSQNYGDGYEGDVTTVSNANKSCYAVNLITNGGNTSYIDISTVQIEFGDTVTEYEPFGDVYDITFPTEAGTVYGGTLDVTTGVLTVDRAKTTIGENTWTVATTTGGISGFACTELPRANGAFDILTDKYATAVSGHGWGANMVDKTIVGNASSRYVYIRDDAYTTVEDFKAAMGDTTIVFRLRNPYTITLSPTEVKTLLQTNNIFADTGDIASVDYVADTKTYIDAKTSAAQKLMELIVTANREDSMTASANYSIGDLIIVEGTLYKATAAIASGATMTAGTNVAQTTIAAELAALA